ncbi:MAG: hypothetical protein AAF039_03810 [Bacteroidota bacterium]
MGQTPMEHYVPDDFKVDYHKQFAKKKKIPERIQSQALIALSHFQELKDTRITFRLRKRKTPLTSRPRIFSSLLPKGWRSYVITISTETIEEFAPILFEKLPYNAQIGVLGHEIAHIVGYKEKSTFQLLGLPFKLSNAEFVDEFEFHTDKTAINHGLGYQLLDWSIFVQKSLHVNRWFGAFKDFREPKKPTRERYMTPPTIKAYMKEYSLYSSF